MLKTIIIGIIVTVVGLFSLAAVNKVVNGNTSTSVNGYQTKVTSSDSNTVNVSISGEINHPGSYYINPEETLGDLITLAGGVTTSADSSAYNTSLVINTRTSFYIAPLLVDSGVCVDTNGTKTNINTATQEELVSVGFKTTQASALITYRNENGSFGAIDDILNVSGIGASTFNKVKNKICIA
jgi:competence protein ComEA